MIQKKHTCLAVLLTLNSLALFAQIDCPDFKIRSNRSPRSNPFTTAIKFQLDGIAQFIGEVERPVYGNRLGLFPAFSLGIEQTLHRKISLSLMHGWTMNRRAGNSRFLSGDVRYFFDHTFEGRWFSARQTMTDGAALRHFTSLHWGKTGRKRLIFSHYEMGVGYAPNRTFLLIFGVNTGLKLN